MATTKEERMEIATEILRQMGGRRFQVMTGCKDFVAIDIGLQMTIRRNKSKANRLTVYYNYGSDTYTMRFWKYVPGRLNKKTYEWIEDKITEVTKYEEVYFDQLQELFTEVTGLLTRIW